MPRPCLLTEELGHVAARIPGIHPEAINGKSGPVKNGDNQLHRVITWLGLNIYKMHSIVPGT